MEQDRTNLIVAVLAGLTIGWFLGMGWWHVPGRFFGIVLALGLIVVLVGRSRAEMEEKSSTVADKIKPIASHKKLEEKQLVREADVDGVLSPEEARKWLDDLLVEQQDSDT